MLETRALEIGYFNNKNHITVSKNIEIQLEPGQMAAVVGINGIGKSTLLRTLAGVQDKLSGTIEINGKEQNEFSSRDWAMEVSTVLTEPLASKNLTVQQLISLGRHPYTNWIGSLSGYDIQVIQEAMEQLALIELRNKKCYELSDGQIQKVMIARALAQGTRIIFLDEPTTHLDLYHKVQILKILQRIAHSNDKIVLYTTHEIDLALQLCDRVLIMEAGQSTFGTPQDLIEQGCFTNLFPADTIRFDPKSASFKIR